MTEAVVLEKRLGHRFPLIHQFSPVFPNQDRREYNLKINSIIITTQSVIERARI
jgi:hypothetical protein